MENFLLTKEVVNVSFFYFLIKGSLVLKKKDQEKKKMGKYPPSWGPGAWDTMMAIADSYPTEPNEEQKKNMLEWVKLTILHLPCPSCSLHARAYIAKHIPDVTNRDKLIHYIVDFHNFVNVSLGKPTFTYLEAKAAYMTKLATDYRDLPHAMLIVKENATKIKELQLEISKYQKASTVYEQNTNHSVYFYSTIGLGTALGVLLLLFIVVFIMHKRSKRHDEQPKYSIS
jgi:hypothetical protein